MIMANNQLSLLDKIIIVCFKGWLYYLLAGFWDKDKSYKKKD